MAAIPHSLVFICSLAQFMSRLKTRSYKTYCAAHSFHKYFNLSLSSCEIHSSKTLLEVTRKRNQETYTYEQLSLYEVVQHVKRQEKEIALSY